MLTVFVVFGKSEPDRIFQSCCKVMSLQSTVTRLSDEFKITLEHIPLRLNISADCFVVTFRISSTAHINTIVVLLVCISLLYTLCIAT